MEVFLVGGAVRDKLLSRPVKDHDFVVVGATVEDMLAKGFEQVGADFPVFLHPETKDEYALARIERKSGSGHTGFVTETDGVTLEDDLFRRDLTINAMAQDFAGNIIDPHGGMNDIRDRVLRHVSLAFAEDPLRVLRVARFMARFWFLGFTIANETMDLMKELVKNGELHHLTPERVWAETEKALKEPNPAAFFNVLNEVGALDVIFPEVGGRQIDILGEGSEVDVTGSPITRFAMLAMTLSPHDIERMTERTKIPNDFASVARVAEAIWHNIDMEFPQLIMGLFKMTDAFRRPDLFRNGLRAVMSVATWLPEDDILKMLDECLMVSGQQFVDAGFVGPEVGDQIENARLKIIANLILEMNKNELLQGSDA